MLPAFIIKSLVARRNKNSENILVKAKSLKKIVSKLGVHGPKGSLQPSKGSLQELAIKKQFLCTFSLSRLQKLLMVNAIPQKNLSLTLMHKNFFRNLSEDRNKGRQMQFRCSVTRKRKTFFGLIL